MNNQISQAFQKGKAFVAYIMAGDPSLEKTKEYILEIQKAGADLIEIGIPFSDPIAEGEVIQRASVRALSSGTTMDNVFDMVQSIKDELTIPVAFMTYLNPVFVYGYDRFFEKCRQCGVSGIIIPDLPFEEQKEVREIAEKYGVDSIVLVAPTSHARIKNIASSAKGFIYLVSSMGVTGMRNTISTDIPAMVKQIRAHTDTPIAVGFGISTPEQATVFSQQSDGVIVGSAIVKIIEEHGVDAKDKLFAYVKSMTEAVHK